MFVLVHGAFHGRWCFRRLVTALESRGHRAIAIDLPGHGDDESDPSTVMMTDYVKAVRDVLDSVEHDEPILVGHSMAGMVISQVAEECANRLAGLAYLAAYLPKSGESLMAIEGRNPAPRVAAAITPTPDLKLANIDAEMAAPIFYNGCSEADTRFSVSRLCPQPGAPFFTPVSLTEESFGAVPKGYFLCEEDLAIPPALQREMAESRDEVSVYNLLAGHSPFFSQVESLADGLQAFAHDVLVKADVKAA